MQTHKAISRLGTICLLMALPVLATLAFPDDRSENAKSTAHSTKTGASPAQTKIQMDRVSLESPSGMKIFRIGLLPVKDDVINKFSRDLELTVKPTLLPNQKILAERVSGFSRIQTDRRRGHMVLLPNWLKVAQAKPRLVAKENAFRLALEFVDRNKLVVKDASSITPKHLVMLSRAELQQGQTAEVQDIGQTVIFQRQIGEKPVMGNGSQLSVDLGHQGEIVGFNRTWNMLSPTTIKPNFKSEQDIYNEVEGQLKQRLQGEFEAKVGKFHLIYYGDDKNYVQPAYFFSVQLNAPGVKGRSFLAGVVAAAKNSPEAIGTIIKPREFPIEKRSALNSTSPARSSSDADPTVGRYVVRQDSSDWVGDANDFKNGLNDGHSSSSPAITFGDYYWDEPDLWTTYEDSYVDKWNITLVEGHGNTWLFTTRSNCCDVVNLNSGTQPGYGDRSGDSMRFLILKGCSIIPAPPDRANWPDPWWRVFKGLRQAIGFRTEMYINDDISYHFGKHLAQNSRVLDSWFHATNSSGSYQWERFWGSWGDEVYGYGAVVMIPGHEGDGIYSTGSAPAASSAGLTIWWQH